VANLAAPDPAGGARDRPTRAVLFDALGTLVELEPPWIGLREALGDDVDEERLIRAVKEEMAFYKQHANEGRDPESLADLRARSAAVLSRGLGQEVPVHVLVDSIRFGPYPDAVPALNDLRARGLRLICVSNWDISLREVLERCGLMDHLDGAVSSAEAAAPKPDPALLLAGCELAGCEPGEALMVGDTPEEDTAAADAAGMRSLIVDREGGGDIASLAEVAKHV
jgi:putative hydrolase of the HAD superfamily